MATRTYKSFVCSANGIRRRVVVSAVGGKGDAAAGSNSASLALASSLLRVLCTPAAVFPFAAATTTTTTTAPLFAFILLRRHQCSGSNSGERASCSSRSGTTHCRCSAGSSSLPLSPSFARLHWPRRFKCSSGKCVCVCACQTHKFTFSPSSNLASLPMQFCKSHTNSLRHERH